MNTERFGGHHEAREALVLSVAGVTTIKRNSVNRAEIEKLSGSISGANLGL
jgi:hypothetical protein